MSFLIKYLNVYRGNKKERLTLSVIYDTTVSIPAAQTIDQYVESLPSDLLEQIITNDSPKMYNITDFITSPIPEGSTYYKINPDIEDPDEMELSNLKYRHRPVPDGYSLPGELFYRNGDVYTNFQGGNARNLYTPDGKLYGSTPQPNSYWDPTTEQEVDGVNCIWWDVESKWRILDSSYLIARKLYINGSVDKFDLIPIYKPYGNTWRRINLLFQRFISDNLTFSDSDDAPFYPLTDSPYDEDSGPSGGNGSHDDGESENLLPLIPDGSAGPDTSKLGLYTRYLMTESQIRNFGDYLYADDIVESITQGIMKALFDSPAEAVISLMHYPFDVSSLVSATSSQIYYGNIPTGKGSSGIMTKSSARIEWGTISLNEFWGNFLDYAPHTKIDLYLPWCVGSVPIDPHECLPGTLGVITNIEFDKGTCIHNVIGNKGAVIGTYSGVVGTQIPVTALDSAGKGLAMVTAAVAGMASAGATGIMSRAAAGPSAARAYGAVMAGGGASSVATRSYYNTEANIMAARERQYSPIARATRNTALAASAAAFRVPPNIIRNGSFSGSGAGLGIQVPYIIISRPTQSVPQNYGRHYGYPSNIYASLGSLVGYTEVGAIHLDGISCTVEERNEIEEFLMGGVML